MKQMRRMGKSKHWMASETFARYAEGDVTRWRQIIGCRVVPTDARWGDGVVKAVTWGSRLERVPPYVQINIEYDAGWTATSRPATWSLHHRCVDVPDSVEAAVHACFDPSLTERERAERLARHARALREQQDRAALDRASRLRRRILDKREAD